MATLALCALAGCPRPAPREAALLSARAVLGDDREGPRYAFDADWPVELRVTGAAAPDRVTWTSSTGVETLRCSARPRGERRFLTCQGPGHLGPGRLQVDGVATAWAAEWRRAPSAYPAIQRARAQVGTQGLAAALATLEALAAEGSEEAVWARVEQAKLTWRHARAAAPAANARAAQAALQAGLEAEAARRYRAAAHGLSEAGRLAEAAGYLALAEPLTPDLPRDRSRHLYERAGLAMDFERYREAEVELRAALSAAEAAGAFDDVPTYAQALARTLTELGRPEDALRILAQHRPEPDAAAEVRALHAYERAAAQAAAEPSATDAVDALVMEAYQAAREASPELARELGWAGALAAARAGRPGDAAAWVARARDGEGAGPEPLDAGMVAAALLLTGGDPEAAEARLEWLAARARAQVPPHRDTLIAIAELRVEAALARGDWAGVARHATAALDDARALARQAALRRSAGALLARQDDLRALAALAWVRQGDAARALAVGDRVRAEVLRRLAHAALRAPPAGWQALEAARSQLLARAQAGCWAEGAQRGACEAALAADLDAWGAQVAAQVEEPPRAHDLAEPGLEALQARLRSDRELAGALVVTVERAGATWVTLTLDALGTSARTSTARPQRPDVLGDRAPSHVFLVADDLDLFTTLAAGGAAGPTVSLVPYAGWLARRPAHAAGPAVIVADPTGELPSAQAEGRWLADRLPDAVAFVGPSGTSKAALAGAGLLHFAGHGLLMGKDPWETALALGPGGALTFEDILALRPHPRLAVLNGCDTGRVASASLVGLPQALLSTGTWSVVATVRPVRDASAAAMMRAFYTAGGADRPGVAFRAAVAQLQAAGDPAWRDFRLWGWP